MLVVHLCMYALYCALVFIPHIKEAAAEDPEQTPARNNNIRPADSGINLGPTWMECHGFPEGTCKYIKDKVAELEQLLAQRAQTDGQTYANQLLPNATDDHLEQVFLTPDQIQYFINILSSRRRHKRKVDSFSQFVTKWPLPIKYTFDGTHDSFDRKKIKKAINHWEAQTCLRFQEVSAGLAADGQNKIMFMKHKGCGSYIGKVNISPQPVDLASRCLRHFGIIAHEIGHVIGFWHEHQRSDRDSYIRIKTTNAVVGMSFVSELMRLGRTSNLLPYDYGSVLHYSAKTMSANGDYTIETKDPLYQRAIGQRTGLSFLDAKLANMVYCSDSCQYPLRLPCQNNGYQDPNNCNVCRCPDGFGGNDCASLAPSVNAACGGEIPVPRLPHVMSSPHYQRGYYDDHTECTWLLTAPAGYKILLRFLGDFGVYCIDGSCFHWVEVRYNGAINNIGPRFCCQDLPRVTLQSFGNQMMVLFRSNYTTSRYSRRGFQFSYWSVPDANLAANTPVPRSWYTHGPNTQQVVPTRAPLPGTPIPRPSSTTNAPWTYPNRNSRQQCSPLDVAFVLDSSGSVGVHNWPKLIDFAVAIVERLPVSFNEVRIGAVSFGSSASLHFGLLGYTDVPGVAAGMRNIRWKDQMTNTSGGLWLTRESLFTPPGGDRPWAPNVAILVTDGESNRDEHRTIPEALIAKQSGITLMVVGVGSRLRRPEVEAIASRPLSANLFFANTFGDLPGLEQPLIERLCALADRATGPPPPTSPPRPTTTEPPPPRTTRFVPSTDCLNPGPADIAFVVDSSGSIGPINWRKILDFLKTFIGYLSITQGRHRVGVVTFGTYATFEFRLDSYRTEWGVRQGIDRLHWRDEMTNTSGGIKVMRELLFDPRRGDRPGVPNIGIILTDGESNRDPHRVRPEADRARAAGISLFALGIGTQVNAVELQAIANQPHDRFLYRTDDFNNLQRLIVSVITAMCTIAAPATYLPTKTPTTYPTHYPTQYPTVYPTPFPSPSPTPGPTQSPTPGPTPRPTQGPTQGPTPNRTPFPSPPSTTQRPPWLQTTRPSFPPSAGCSRTQADVVFVLDSSGSIGASNWPIMLNFTKALIRLMPYGPTRNQFSVITFGNRATLNVRLGQFDDPAAMFAAIDRIRWKDEWTNTSGGLRVMREQLFSFNDGARASATKVGILVTDGESNRDRANTLPEAELVHREGIHMYAIGVGPNIDLPEIRFIASNPDDRYLTRIDSFQTLWTMASQLAEKICSTIPDGQMTTRPAVSVYPPVTTRPTPSPATPSPPTPAPPVGVFQYCHPLDIGIALDSSNSVGPANWRHLLQFVTEIVRLLPMGSNNDRLGVITFGTTARLDIPLGRYLHTDSLIDAIYRLPWRNEWTNTSGAILVMRSQLLADVDHSRTTVPKIGIVVTDGRSNIDAHLTIPEADVARQQGIELYAVGVTSQVNRDEVTGIANQPTSAHAFFTDRFDRLYQIRDNLVRSICSRYNRGPDPFVGGKRPYPRTVKPIPTTTSSTTTTTTDPGWGAWTTCSRPCGGCGRKWRYRQCADSYGRLISCGVPDETSCNLQPCTNNDVCSFYVASVKYKRPCQPCCYGYEADFSNNICIPV